MDAFLSNQYPYAPIFNLLFFLVICLYNQQTPYSSLEESDAFLLKLQKVKFVHEFIVGYNLDMVSKINLKNYFSKHALKSDHP
jgi:hypothetical protein